jgi:hypothetical protein
MRKHFAIALASAAIAWLGGTASADGPLYVVPQGQGCCAGCDGNSRGGWYGSVGVLFLKEVGSRDLAYETRIFDNTAPPAGPAVIATIPNEFTHEYRLSGEAELGWKNCDGFGFRGRFFWIHDSAATSFVDDQGFQSDPNFPGLVFNQKSGVVFHSGNPEGLGFSSVGTADSPSVFSASSRLRLQSLDLEATSDSHLGCLETTWSAGLRWLHIAQNYDASDVVINPDNIVAPNVIPRAQFLTSGYNINAFGPTIGLGARYPISSSFSAVAQTRFAILYANSHAVAHSTEVPVDPAFYQPLLGLTNDVTESRCSVLPVGELELGGEYTRTLGCNGPELFVRGSVLSQCYWGAGRAAHVNLNNNPIGTGEDLIFFGFSLSVGVRY